MPDGSPLPAELFQFTHEEMALAPHMLELLTPDHLKNNNNVKLLSSNSSQYIPSSTTSSSATSGETSGGEGGSSGGGGGFIGSRTSL